MLPNDDAWQAAAYPNRHRRFRSRRQSMKHGSHKVNRVQKSTNRATKPRKTVPCSNLRCLTPTGPPLRSTLSSVFACDHISVCSRLECRYRTLVSRFRRRRRCRLVGRPRRPLHRRRRRPLRARLTTKTTIDQTSEKNRKLPTFSCINSRSFGHYANGNKRGHSSHIFVAAFVRTQTVVVVFGHAAGSCVITVSSIR